MAEPQTVNCGIIVPNTGDLVGTWGSAALNPDFVAVDGYLGGVQTVSASSSPIVLTSPAAYTPTPGGGPTQAQNAVIRVTGVLTAGVQITLPLPGYMIVENLTTGAFVVTLRAIGSGEIIGIEQGVIVHVYNDGTNVRFVNLPTVGSYMDVCDAGVPTWITACTKPPWLNCDGSTFSAVTYPYLNVKLGGTTLPDSRGRSRYALNQGTSRITSGGNSIDGNTRFAGGGSQTLGQTNLPNVSFTISGITLNNGAPSVFVDSTNPVIPGSQGIVGSTRGATIQLPAQAVFTNVTVVSQGVAASGGSGTSITSPGYVGGLTLIRAA